jgi:hypothetical protein
MTENVAKLVGVALMAALVVVGVAVSSGDDTNFTRNGVFVKLDGFRQLPEAEQARLAPAFLEQAAPKSLDTGPINKINSEVGPIAKGAKASIVQSTLDEALSTGKASVLEGRGVDGKGGTSSLMMDSRQVGVVSGQDIEAIGGVSSLKGNYEALIEDRIQKWNDCSAPDNLTVNSLKDVLVTSYTAEQATDEDHKDWACVPSGDGLGGQEGEALLFDNPGHAIRVGKDEAGLLAECMESKVSDVFLKSHIEVSAADCVATVMPALSPDRAKRLGTYWQTRQQFGDGTVRF